MMRNLILAVATAFILAGCAIKDEGALIKNIGMTDDGLPKFGPTSIVRVGQVCLGRPCAD